MNQIKIFPDYDYTFLIFGSVCAAFAAYSLTFSVQSRIYLILLSGAVFFLLKVNLPPRYLRIGIGAVLMGIFCKAVIETDVVNLSLAGILYLIFHASYRQTAEIHAEKLKENFVGNETENADDQQISAKMEFLLEERARITEALQKSREALEKAAYYDTLTEIPNRAYLFERLDLLIKLGIDIADSYYVLFLDLSRFKNINDSLGHTIGDKVLTSVAQRLKNILRDEDTIARIGGDEFAVILKDLSSLKEAEEYAAEIYRKLSTPYGVDGYKIYTDLHIGISPFDADHLTPEDVLRDADIAMRAAKENNRRIGIFDRALRGEFLERIKLENDLRFAVRREELVLHYQPLINLRDGKLTGFETLLRWQHPKFGFISPDKFIPLAEESNLIIPITEWILRQACRQIAEWRKISREFENLKISVNLSGKHLADGNLPAHIQTALENAGLPPQYLTLELTETVATENAAQAVKMFQKLRRLGVGLSIDDFGTGYSSLSYLHNLPFNSLKIDRSFISDFKNGGENTQILQTIVTLAKNLDLGTVAEGIETEEQLQILQNLGCDAGQGYLFSKPLPSEEIEKMLCEDILWLPKFSVGFAENRDSIRKVLGDAPRPF